MLAKYATPSSETAVPHPVRKKRTMNRDLLSSRVHTQAKTWHWQTVAKFLAKFCSEQKYEPQ